MSERVWAIKLGSGGICVDFCEKHNVVGVGWVGVDPTIAGTADRAGLWKHLRELYRDATDVTISNWTGQIFRFAQECQTGDYVLYYDPPRKHVRICRVVSEALYRDFDLNEAEREIDIWHYRKVKYPVPAVPILDFYGSLKGRLLGPRMAFWELADAYEVVAHLATGRLPNVTTARDSEITQAYTRLRELVVERAEALNDKDWEWVVVDYLKAQGASVNESKVGGSRPIIDVEARFDHGELGDKVWRVQVKRYQGQKVDWPTIERDFQVVGEARFCYVSVFGFTEQARQLAQDRGVRLMDAADFAFFLLTGKVRESIRQKLRLPVL